MNNNEQMTGNDREYPESDISENQKQTTNQEQQGQSQSSPNDKDDAARKGNSTYIKDMPEIIPARTGVI